MGQVGPMETVRHEPHDPVDRFDRDRYLQEILVHDLHCQDIPGAPGFKPEGNPLFPQPLRDLVPERRKFDYRSEFLLWKKCSNI